jgi:hypothetical protein
MMTSMSHETLKSLQRDRNTPEERMALGKAVRAQTTSSALGDYKVKTQRTDVIDVLKAQAKSRIPDLIPIRHARMADNPFAFFQGGDHGAIVRRPKERSLRSLHPISPRISLPHKTNCQTMPLFLAGLLPTHMPDPETLSCWRVIVGEVNGL